MFSKLYSSISNYTKITGPFRIITKCKFVKMSAKYTNLNLGLTGLMFYSPYSVTFLESTVILWYNKSDNGFSSVHKDKQDNTYCSDALLKLS